MSLEAIDAVRDGACSSQCVFGREDPCDCRCDGRYHGALLDEGELSRPERQPLVGRFCHTFNAEGQYSRQGQVLARVSDGIYEVQWYSAWDGIATYSELVALGDMDCWHFHDGQEEWRACADEMHEAVLREMRWEAERAKRDREAAGAG